MDIVPILSTIILIATIITLIVAVASYLVFRIKERAREARAAAARRQKAAEGEPEPETEEYEDIEDDEDEEPAQQPEARPSRQAPRERPTAQPASDAPLSINTQAPPRPQPSGPSFSSGMDRPSAQTPPAQPSQRRRLPNVTTNSRDLLHERQDIPEPEQQASPPPPPKQNLSGAQAAFVASMNLDDTDWSGVRGDAGDSGIIVTGQQTGGSGLQLRKFEVPRNSFKVNNSDSSDAERVEWK
ncbi:hypothetical protein GF324_08280 [bacterium]|nr:hypothetical protein [bacterium]